MPIECSSEMSGFARAETRRVVVGFDGATMTEAAGIGWTGVGARYAITLPTFFHHLVRGFSDSLLNAVYIEQFF